MGYRSTIYAKFERKDKEKFNSILKEYDLDGSFEEQDDEDTSPFVRFIGWDLKWYDNYKDVAAINNFICEEDENNDSLRGLLAVGEDGAVMQYGNPDDVEMYESTNVDW